MTTAETYIWHVWPARHYPASAVEEEIFYSDLTAASSLARGETIPFERGDATTVLNTLRNGMTLDELLAVAPGVKVDRLVSAYRHLDALRVDALTAFTDMCANLCDRTVNAARPASALLPVPTYRLISAFTDATAKNATNDEASAVCALISDMASAALDLESRLADPALDRTEAVRLGRTLYDPFLGGLWSHPYYASCRVGTLTPDRVRDLFGEKER